MKSGTLREREKAKRRAQILRAAEKIFARRGFHKSTLSEIAKEAGLGKATLYWYFPNKTRLFMAVFEEAIDDQLRVARKALEGASGCRSRIEAITKEQLRHFAKNQYLFKICASEGTFPRDEIRQELGGFLEHKHAQYTRLLEEVFAEGMRTGEIRQIDAGSASHLFLGILHSVAWHWQLHAITPDPDREGCMVCDIIFEGLRNRP